MNKQISHEVPNKDIRMLAGAILDYLCQIKSDKGNKDSRKVMTHAEILTDFLIYVIREEIICKDMFTFDTFINFRNTFNVFFI